MTDNRSVINGLPPKNGKMTFSFTQGSASETHECSKLDSLPQNINQPGVLLSYNSHTYLFCHWNNLNEVFEDHMKITFHNVKEEMVIR